MTLVPIGVLLLGIAAIVIPYALAPTVPPAAAGETAPVSAPAPEVDDPSDLLIDEIRGGTAFEADPAHRNGLGIKEAAALHDQSTEQDRLARLGYERGAIRWWAVAERDAMYISVFEFAAEEDAQAYVTDVSFAVAGDSTVTPVWVPVPDAVAYGYAIPAEGAYGYEVHFAKGRRVYRVVLFNANGQRGNEELLAAVAEEQYTDG